MTDNIVNTIRYSRHEKLTTYFFDEVKQYRAVLTTRLGSFVGVATCDENDKFEPYIGNTLAERRAWMGYRKAMRNRCRNELEALTNFYSSVKDMKAFDENDKIVSKLRRAIYEKNDQLNAIKCQISRDYKDIEKIISWVNVNPEKKAAF